MRRHVRAVSPDITNPINLFKEDLACCNKVLKDTYTYLYGSGGQDKLLGNVIKGCLCCLMTPSLT